MVPSRTELNRDWGAKGFIKGIIRLEVETDAVELHPGEEALIPAHANHSVYNIGGTEARWYFGYHSR